MTYTSADTMLQSTREVCFPMPSLAMAPAAWFLGVHMLKCIQDVSLKMGGGEKSTERLPRRRTFDKSTQTVASFTQKKVTGRRTPTKGAPRRTDTKTSGEDLKIKHTKGKSVSGDLKTSHKKSKSATEDLKSKHTKSKSVVEDLKSVRTKGKSVCETKPGIRSSKSDSLKRRCSLETKKSVKSEVKKTEGVNQKDGMPSSNLKSRPTKGCMTKEKRRLSTGDCPKRASESCADLDRAKWLKNPVYASDGESDGRRTDRSDMSPPWLDISVAKEVTRTQSDQKTVTSPSVLDLAKAAARHVPARIRSTQPKMEVVPEASRTVNLRNDGPSTPMAPSAVSRVLSATDIAIRQTIERKLGKPLSEVDTASLKSISERRMKELTEKYARNRPNAKLLDRDIPASIVARLHPRARDSADSICQTVDPQRGRVVV